MNKHINIYVFKWDYGTLDYKHCFNKRKTMTVNIYII